MHRLLYLSPPLLPSTPCLLSLSPSSPFQIYHLTFKENHLHVISTDLSTCWRTRIRMLGNSGPTFPWLQHVLYSCSKTGLTCIAIMGSMGSMAAAKWVIQLSLSDTPPSSGPASISRFNWCKMLNITIWLRGRGYIDKIPSRSTLEHNQEMIFVDLSCDCDKAVVKAFSCLFSYKKLEIWFLKASWNMHGRERSDEASSIYMYWRED